MDNSDISVLLVDDEVMVRDCITAFLEDEGFRVYSAGSGEDALESIASLCPSVCLTDLHLPGITGEEFIIKAHALCPGTGYLIHTGMLYSLSDELCAIGMTADDILLKPIHNLSSLVSKIRCIAVAGSRA